MDLGTVHTVVLGSCLLLAVIRMYFFKKLRDNKEFSGEGKQPPRSTASPLTRQQYFPGCHWNYPCSELLKYGQQRRFLCSNLAGEAAGVLCKLRWWFVLLLLMGKLVFCCRVELSTWQFLQRA